MASEPTTAPRIEDAVRDFDRLSHDDVPFAGGKGANLGELTAAGLPVPPGFVVGAPAYASYCDSGGLRERIGERLADVDPEDTEALDRATAEVRRMVEAQPVPEWLAAAIRESYESVAVAAGDPAAPVAVRSSATAEDTEAASFAGMNETFLNVTGADDAVDAVRRCWSSLFGARTVYYRAKRGFGQADMDIAVVVQLQVLSTRAGVMFTIDPASGDADRLVIEGSFGLGEAVVSGSVSPDRYIVHKDDLAILAREVRRKELVIEPKAGGGTVIRELEKEEAATPVLSDDEVREIAGLGRRIEEHYGSAQDTEWCYDPEGNAWMLQSRPVTSAGGVQLGDGGGEHVGEVLLRGLGAAPGVGAGRVRVVTDLADADGLGKGDILVTHMTAPDWVPLMR
jgi:pyruvate,water dikinase